MPVPARSIGSMRQIITVQQASTTVDALGGLTETWATAATIWGRVEPLTGNERLQAGERTATQPYRVTTRYRSDVGVKNRLVWSGRTLEILSVVNEDARGQWLTLDCAEVTT